MIAAAAATTQITPKKIARERIARGSRERFFAPGELLGRIGRGGCVGFLRRSEILLNEIFWSLRSALSRY